MLNQASPLNLLKPTLNLESYLVSVLEVRIEMFLLYGQDLS